MKKSKWYNVLILLTIVFLATMLSYAFEAFQVRIENIMLIQIVGMMIVMIETKKFIYALIAAILSVFIFNFLFINPKYTFVIDDPNYIIMLLIFFIVAVIVNMLTNRLQTEVNKAKKSEEKIKELYRNSKTLLNLNSKESIIQEELSYLFDVIKHPVMFYFKQRKVETYSQPKPFIDIDNYKNAIHYAIEQDIICGQNENKFSDIPIVIFPFKKNHHVNGAIIMDVTNDHLNKYEKDFIVANMLLILMALEREHIEREKELSKIDIEREKLKSSLLRSLSHDLRTPLTSLQAGSSFILDSYNQLDDAMIKSIINDIHMETTQLADYVENLLSMTKISSGKLTINRKNELIMDILNDVYQRVYKRIGQHQLEIQKDSKLEYIYIDSLLITQVFINLIDNALKHTKDDSHIDITYQCDDHGVWFNVSDNGGGIATTMIDKLFVDFASHSEERSDTHRGSGLGLSISKSIIDAHGGIIEGFNNDQGGATFRFYIPNKE